MAFSLILADEIGAVQDHEKSELASMERAIEARGLLAAPRKVAIDFWNQSTQPSTPDNLAEHL